MRFIRWQLIPVDILNKFPKYQHFLVIFVIVGFLFWIFAWVPYKQTERYLNILARDITLSQIALKELDTLTEPVSSKHSLGVSLKKQIASNQRILQLFEHIEKISNQGFTKELPSMLFYPSFRKNVLEDLGQEVSIDSSTLANIKLTLQADLEVNKALMNLVMLDPDGIEKDALIPLNEAIGATEISLSALEKNSNHRIKPTLEWIGLVHRRVLGMVEYSDKNSQAYEAEKGQLDLELRRIKNNLTNTSLLNSSVKKENVRVIHQLLDSQNNILQKVEYLLGNYF